MSEIIEELEEARKLLVNVEHDNKGKDAYCLISDALTALKARDKEVAEGTDLLKMLSGEMLGCRKSAFKDDYYFQEWHKWLGKVLSLIAQPCQKKENKADCIHDDLYPSVNLPRMAKIKGAKQKERYNLSIRVEKHNQKNGILYLFFLEWHTWYRHGEQKADQFRCFEKLLEVSKLGASPQWAEKRQKELENKYPPNLWEKS